MKIIIIGPAHPLRGGGMATFNERLAQAFQADGHFTAIWTFSLQYPSFLFPGKSQYTTEPAPIDISIRVCINSINPWNWIKVGRQLKKERPDIIVVRFWLPFMAPCLGTLLRIAKKNKFSKVICIADNVVPHEKRIGDHLLTQYFMSVPDAFITMSKQVQEDVKKFSSKPARYVPHPLYDNFGEAISKQEARRRLSLGEHEFVILFFGFIRKYKGLDLLLSAMPKIISAIPQVKLMIAGEFYDDPKKYESLILSLGISSHILLHTSFIANDQIKNYFCAADIVVQPYKNATQSGVTPLAYHFELPMMVTQVGALADMVPDAVVGKVAEPTAPDIAEKIIMMYQAGTQSYIPAIREQKKQYSWQNMVDAILAAAK